MVILYKPDRLEHGESLGDPGLMIRMDMQADPDYILNVYEDEKF